MLKTNQLNAGCINPPEKILGSFVNVVKYLVHIQTNTWSQHDLCKQRVLCPNTQIKEASTCELWRSDTETRAAELLVHAEPTGMFSGRVTRSPGHQVTLKPSTAAPLLQSKQALKMKIVKFNVIILLRTVHYKIHQIHKNNPITYICFVYRKWSRSSNCGASSQQTYRTHTHTHGTPPHSFSPPQSSADWSISTQNNLGCGCYYGDRLMPRRRQRERGDSHGTQGVLPVPPSPRPRARAPGEAQPHSTLNSSTNLWL